MISFPYAQCSVISTYSRPTVPLRNSVASTTTGPSISFAIAVPAPQSIVIRSTAASSIPSPVFPKDAVGSFRPESNTSINNVSDR